MERGAALEGRVRGLVEVAFVAGGQEVGFLDATTDLVDLGIVDSMNVLRLVDVLEEEFDFILEPEELHQLRSLAGIVALVRAKTDLDAHPQL